jgi:putative addiction module killer protein
MQPVTGIGQSSYRSPGRRLAPKRLPGGQIAVKWLNNCKHCAIDRLYPLEYNCLLFTVRQTEEFVHWLDGLKDKSAQLRIAARLRRIEAGNLGDWRPIEGKLAELRVDYGPGYWLYFTRRGTIVVVILNAGDKTSQKRDIRRALKLVAELGDDT